MMEAGRELDALVAEKVAIEGVRMEDEQNYRSRPEARHRGPYWHYDGGYRQQFQPSTDIAAAWTVVEARPMCLWRVEQTTGSWRWRAELTTIVVTERGTERDEYGIIVAEADTAPLAICLAALAAVGAEVPA